MSRVVDLEVFSLKNWLVTLFISGFLPLSLLAQEGYGTPPQPGSFPSSSPSSTGDRDDSSRGSRTSKTPTARKARTNKTSPGQFGGESAVSYPGQSTVQEAYAMGAMAPRRPYRAFWSLQLGGQFTRDSLANQKTQSSLGFNFGIDYDFTPYFSLSVNPRVSFKNGHVQAATSTNGRESSMELVNAAAILTDRNYYLLSAGALDMTATHSPLLVAATFPAAKVQLSTGEKKPLALSLIALTAVPSSATMTSNSQDYDKTPSFGSASLRLTYNNKLVETLLQVGQFEFKDIPLNVSTDSNFLGNTPLEAANSPQSSFKYRYSGVESRLGLTFTLTDDLKYRFQGSMIRNSGAPQGYNQGYVVANDLEYAMSGTWTFLPGFTYFNVQPDTTVANYNDSMITTNRVGYATGLIVQYKKLFKVELLAVTVRWFSKKPLRPVKDS